MWVSLAPPEERDAYLAFRATQRPAAGQPWKIPWPGQFPDVARTYPCVCTEDNIIPPAKQREMAGAPGRGADSDCLRSHAVFSLQPRDVAAVLAG